MPIRLISTDFDGTIFAEFANPPIPRTLQNLLGALQRRGVAWVINTGRELGSLLETLGRAQVSTHPDALVLVEREIYVRQEGQHYVPLKSWNDACTAAHRELFERVRPGMGELMKRLEGGHPATFYEDAFSPLCVIAETVPGADAIQAELERFAESIPYLTIVRNDVYIRFSHASYNKGTALAEVARRLRIGPESILAAGDHYNDLPMMRPDLAKWLVAPSNAIPEIQAVVRSAGGYVSPRPAGEGVMQGIEFALERASDE